MFSQAEMNRRKKKVHSRAGKWPNFANRRVLTMNRFYHKRSKICTIRHEPEFYYESTFLLLLVKTN